MEDEKQPIYRKTWFWIVCVLIVIGIFSQMGNDPNNTTKANNYEDKGIIYEQSINDNISKNLIQENVINTNATQSNDEKNNLITSNGYRFKNTVDEVTLYFKEIYIVSEWKNIKPHNDYFLIMNVTATSNTPSDSLYYFPFIVSDSTQKEYISINDTFKYNYEDSEGNTADIATEINLGYVKKEDGKISAYNTAFVSGGNGTRYVVFDISKETAEDSQIYFVFSGTKGDRYKDEVSSKNIYFSNYIEKR